MAAYLSNKRGNLYDEEDIDDDSFLRNSRTTNYMLNDDRTKHTGNSFLDVDERRNQLLQKQKEIEQRTVNSTERSLQYLRNSEEVGVATAEELMRQREQLEGTERRLDDINATLRISQKHIQGIKSVFGGLKNYFSGTRNIPNSSSSHKESSGNKITKADPPLLKTAKSDDVMSHPGMRIRQSEDDKPKPSTASHQERVDENLGHMLNHMSRLKGLAYDLSSEIDSQNKMIDDIYDKAERAERTISKQNKDIRKLT
uniref:Synaptosomal-associated protein 29 n=2 Tax=Lygus hesperus TaxID=30085 RepID=A0A146LGG4_LYGHE